MKPQLLSALAWALITAGSAHAAGLEPPGYPAALLNTEPTLAAPPAPLVRLGNLDLILERTRLGDLARAMRAPITREREGDASRDWICLSSSEAGQAQRIWLISSKADGSITEAQVEAAPAHKSCPRVGPELMPARVGAGVHLGQSRTEVLQLLGQPSREEDGWLFYMADSARSTPGRSGHELNILGVRLAQGRVARVLATQLTSP